jgi:ubiquinone/menaquinone biosynthesis C-methylase UbiE
MIKRVSDKYHMCGKLDAISHDKQHDIWEQEHKKPYVLKQMDSDEPSGGVVRFFEWLASRKRVDGLKGLEMCCGKGRSVIWLAKQKIAMTGFDFSKYAIEEANRRAKTANVEQNTNFLVQDATKRWAFESGYFDFVIDCFASTDIEGHDGRAFARDEAIRVLKLGGYLLVYTLSTDNEFHKEMIKISPVSERNAFLHPTTGKFEKTFDRQELLDFYSDLSLVESERIQKTTTFFGKEYRDNNFWMIFQK